MKRNGQDRRVVVEDRLRAVPVMDVDIDDRDTLELVIRLAGARGDGDVVEDAEASAALGNGMVAGVPYQRKSVVGVSRDDLRDRDDGCTRAEHGPVERVTVKGSETITRVCCTRSHRIDVLRAVDAAELVVGRGSRRSMPQAVLDRERCHESSESS